MTDAGADSIQEKLQKIKKKLKHNYALIALCCYKRQLINISDLLTQNIPKCQSKSL